MKPPNEEDLLASDHGSSKKKGKKKFKTRYSKLVKNESFPLLK